MDLLVKKIHSAATLLILLVVCAIAPLAQSGRSGMRGYVAFENLSYNDVAERKVHETELGVVGLFGVGETGAFTEPSSAVAPDAGVKLGDDGRQFKGSRKTHFFAREPHKVDPIYARVHPA